MRQTAVYISILLTIIASAAVPARARDDDPRNRAYGFLMMEEPVNPRNIGMGSAGAALGGPGFRYYNPASPFFGSSSYLSAEFGQMPGGVNRGGFESAMRFPDWFAAVSFHSSSVDFETRDERGYGAEASSGTTFGALTAGLVRGGLSLAANLTLAEDRVWVENNYSAAAFSAGLGYALMDGKLNLGAALSHYAAWSKGFGDNASNWSSEGLVPRYARAGAAWADTLLSFPYTIAADVVYHDEDGKVTVPAGIEVKVLPYISVRAGKRIGWDNEVMSLGLGLNIDKISFDAAFVPTVFVSDYEIKWSMSFTYKVGAGAKRHEKMPPVLITPLPDEDAAKDDVGPETGDNVVDGTDGDVETVTESPEPEDSAVGPAESEEAEEADDVDAVESTAAEESAEAAVSEETEVSVDDDAVESTEERPSSTGDSPAQEDSSTETTAPEPTATEESPLIRENAE